MWIGRLCSFLQSYRNLLWSIDTDKTWIQYETDVGGTSNPKKGHKDTQYYARMYAFDIYNALKLVIIKIRFN